MKKTLYTKCIENSIKKKNFISYFKLKKKIFFEKNNRKLFFNKYLISSLNGHKDRILCIQPHPKVSSFFFSGSCDGEIKFWLTHREKCIYSILGHTKFVRGLTVDVNGKNLLSCSDDGTVKMWKISQPKRKPVILRYESFSAISSHPRENFFLTGGKELILWDQGSFRPIQKLIWGLSVVSCVKFNPIETNVVCSSFSNNSIILNDLRINYPVKKMIMEMCANDICWNPKNCSYFTLANKDSNLYSFDLRNLKKPYKIYRGHLMSVLCLDQNPNDQLLASGSEDNTIRFFNNYWSKTLDIFFCERMQRVSAIKFSLNGENLISGSDDGNLRIWSIKKLKKNEATCNFKAFDFLDDIKFFKLEHFYDSFFFNFYRIPKFLKNLLSLKKILSKKNKKQQHKMKKTKIPGYLKFDFNKKKF
jgi:WD repeat and SOF domain-containing protein 1